MSRFTEGYDDDYEPEAVLARGRWEHNARRSLKSARGRKALAEIREALLALPEKRLIEGALCTVGGLDRIQEVTDAEVSQRVARLEAAGMRSARADRERTARWMRQDREEARERLTDNIAAQGTGVCVNGALLWHRLVKQGKTPVEAFAALPAVIDEDGHDPLEETARIAEHDAGIAYTLAWELAYRNDETYGDKAPEERYEAFLAWINAELGDAAATAA